MSEGDIVFFLCVFFFMIFGVGLPGFLPVVEINIKAQKVLGVDDIVKPLYSNCSEAVLTLRFLCGNFTKLTFKAILS